MRKILLLADLCLAFGLAAPRILFAESGLIFDQSQGTLTGQLNVSSGLTASSATLTNTAGAGLTVNSSAYLAVSGGNVGIGTTGPNYKLDVTGSQIGSETTPSPLAVLYKRYNDAAVDNRGAGPSLVFSHGLTSSASGKSAAMSSPSEDSAGYSRSVGLGFWTSATDANRAEVMRISGSGNVGIGTTTPGYKLDVTGGVNISGANWLTFAGVNTLYSSAGVGFFIQQPDASTPTIFRSYTGANQVTILTSGNVGIGTTEPAAKLAVGVSAYSPNLSGKMAEFSSGGGWGYIAITNGNTANSAIAIGGASGITSFNRVTDAGVLSESMRIDSTGNVGIGTASPAYAKLAINDYANTNSNAAVGVAGAKALYASADGLFMNQLSVYDTTPYAQGVGGAISFEANTGSSQKTWLAGIQGYKENGTQNDYAGALLFHTRNSGGLNYERMRITSTGNVGIGTASPGYTLQVNGSMRAETIYLGAALLTTNPVSQYWVAGSPGINYGGGNVGIGTTGPSTLLEVQGTTGLPFRLHNETVGAELAQRFRAKATNGAYVHGDIVMFPGATADTGYIGFRIPYNAAVPGLILNSSGNVGIGTANPQVPLHILRYAGSNGTLRLEGNDNIVGMPGISFNNNNGGAYATFSWDGAKFNLSTGAYINGNVGIGITSPGALLHLSASRPVEKIEATGDHAQLQLIAANNTGGGSPSVDLYRGAANFYGKLFVERGTGGSNQPIFAGASANDLILGSTALVPLKLGVNYDVKLTIDTTGNVGIGTTSPTSGKLQVEGGSADNATGIYGYTNSNGGASIYGVQDNSGGKAIYGRSGSGWAGYFDGKTYFSGNVGIGTASPNYKLSVSGTGAIRNEIVATDTGGTAGLFLRSNGNSSGSTIRDNNKDLEFFTSTVGQAVTIKDNGNVGVGTTGPGYKLEVNGNISFGPNGYLVGDGGNSYFGDGATLVSGAATADTGILTAGSIVFGTNAGAGNYERMRISSTGNVGIGTASPGYTLHVNGSVAGTSAYNNLSDKRFKKDIQPITGALNKIMSLQGITFNWDKTQSPDLKIDAQNHIGFIAQDIEKILPQVVTTTNDKMQTKSVAYGDVVPVLVEAIKEQQPEIERLKADNATLKSEVSSLKEHLNQLEKILRPR